MSDRGVVRALDRYLERAENFAALGSSRPEDQDAALAALSGTVTEQRPDTELDRNILRLRLVMEAKNRGVPWTAIGKALGGISGKAAKREMKHLAARTQRQLLASQGKR